MARRHPALLLACVCAISALLAASAGLAHAAPASVAAQSNKVKLPNEGKCKKSLKPIKVGLITSIDGAILDLSDQADAAVASVNAFNKRGGIKGHCIEIELCNDKNDATTALDCARKFANDPALIATVNDTTSFGSADVARILNEAGVPRIGLSPSTPDLSVPNTFAIGAGGVGTTFMMAANLAKAGYKKIYLIGVDTPQLDAIPPLMRQMLTAYGAQLVGVSKVPAGTTDYQQFLLAAERAGADSIMLPLDENQSVQVLQAANQLGTKLPISGSFGTFSVERLKELLPISKQMMFNAEIPPATADQKRWPILKQLIADLEASGKPELKRDRIKSSPMRSWIAVWHLKTIAEQYADPDNLTRASMMEAMRKATNVDTFGLIPPWTPNASVPVLAFTRISNPWYYTGTFDGKKFKLDKDQLHVANELAGTINYAQPTG